MPNAKHAQRLAIALFAALALVACSKVETTETAAENPGHASGEHGSSSSAGLPAGSIANGEKLASAKGAATGQSCVDCHGAEGKAPIDSTYPQLGGQYADYLAHALQAYRGGDRQHALMSPQAANLSDQDISDLAAYFGSRETELRDLHGVH
ncbi:c-type cytochrome [Pseudoxanthomonas dokdonensis]|uniref:Cytochrome C biogenesis protein CcsA n=1 Tax=Pseudoxanthomonas dokdonensis TaxID=344882 RepID=A0A0R0CZ05_9GAMM|nr:c-type cytochrome [Pseudoxanthomonas dokdonensis]KRG71105.1 cytochrome C biogenesis protein CcsA [Pseudoxanthomonas dokdonensis]